MHIRVIDSFVVAPGLHVGLGLANDGGGLFTLSGPGPAWGLRGYLTPSVDLFFSSRPGGALPNGLELGANVWPAEYGQVDPCGAFLFVWEL